MARASTGTVIETELKDGSRSFAIRYRVDGKRRFELVGYSFEGVTRRTAEERLQDVLSDVRRGLWREPEPEPEPVPRFSEAAEEWFSAQLLEGGSRGTGLSPAGEADLRWRLECHLLPYFEGQLRDPRVDAITVKHVDAYRLAKVKEAADRRAKLEAWRTRLGCETDPARRRKIQRQRPPRPLGATSVNKTLATLAAILERAVEHGHLSTNPASGKRRRLRQPTPPRTRLDRADHIAALIDAASELDRTARAHRGQRRALVALLLFAGPRISEATALRWRDVDLARGEIRIRRSKTDTGVRLIRMEPVLRDELAAYRAGLREVSRDSLVFCTATGEPLGATNVRKRVIDRAREIANERLERQGTEPLPYLTPHSCRRTYATILCALDYGIPFAKQQLGHKSSALTLDVYAGGVHPDEKPRLAALVRGDDWASLRSPIDQPTVANTTQRTAPRVENPVESAVRGA